MFYHSLCLHDNDVVHIDEKRREVVALTEASLQSLPLMLPFSRLEALFKRLVLVREGVIIHDTHGVNTLLPSLPEVAYQ